MNHDLTELHKPEMSVSKETRVFFLWKWWSLIGICLSWNNVSERIVERVGQKQGAGRGKFRKQVWNSIIIRWEKMTGKQISLHFDHNLRILKKRLYEIKFFVFSTVDKISSQTKMSRGLGAQNPFYLATVFPCAELQKENRGPGSHQPRMGWNLEWGGVLSSSRNSHKGRIRFSNSH